MKTGTTIIAVLLVLAVVAPQANAIGIMGSYWNSDVADNGYGLGILHTFGIIPLISIDARASWLNFSESGASLNVFPLEAVGRANLGMFYAGVGLGYYIFDSEVDNDLGFSLLGGVGFGLFGLGAFGEVKYTILDTQIGDMNGVGINLGVTLPF